MTADDLAAMDALPPTQYLILDVLAARLRLGETSWTFPANLRAHANRLEEARWVQVDAGPQGRIRLLPTDRLRATMAATNYRPPTVVDGAVRGNLREAVAAHLLRSFGTVSADVLRPVEGVPRGTVALAEWLAQPDESPG